ncbi:hypothetical protein MnTg02_00248 [bacterium MnTg02]|nr:hypothetical protein MnTg02_00248 [bacterium MnTg02]
MKVSDRWPVWPKNVAADLAPEQRAVKDILDGLAVFFQSAFITDIRDTLITFPDSRLGIALNKKQTACKKWLVEELYNATGGTLGRVYILAGWYGVLGAMLLNDTRFEITHLSVIDQDPSCAPIANALNATSAAEGRFSFQVMDILDLDFRHPSGTFGRADLIVNTSCEHLSNFDDWYRGLPNGTLLVLQSNNYSSIPDHVNCVATLDAFQEQAPMTELLYCGNLELEKYTRFMLIGRK